MYTHKPDPVGAFIEIVEHVQDPTDSSPGGEIIVPNDVRINGQSLWASADDPVIVHEVSTDPKEPVKVTLTLLAKRVEYKQEGRA